MEPNHRLEPIHAEHSNLLPTTMEEFFSEPSNKVRRAVQMNDLEMLKLLIDEGHSTCIPDNRGRVAIHYAIEDLKADCFDILFNAKDFRVNVEDFHGSTPLMYACEHSEATPELRNMVNALLLHPEIDIWIKDNDLNTPLHIAAAAGNLTFVKWMVRLKLGVRQMNLKGYTALYCALMSDCSDSAKIEVSKYLISHGASVWKCDERHNKAIDLCVANPEVSLAILSTVPKDNLMDYIRHTRERPGLIWEAAKHKNLRLVKFLLDLGFKFTLNEFDETIYFHLLNSNDFEMVRLVYESLDLDCLLRSKSPFPQQVVLGGCFPCPCREKPLKETSLWFLTDRYEEFHAKPYRIRFPYYHTPYKFCSLLSGTLTVPTSRPSRFNQLIEFIMHLLSKPGCDVSEDTKCMNLKLMPPLIAANTERHFFDQKLDFLMECNAKVRTRHCFSLLSSTIFDVVERIQFLISKDIFCLADMFEDDLSILVRMLNCSVIDIDEPLSDLLKLRLEYSPITPWQLCKLSRFLRPEQSFPDFPLSRELVDEALKNPEIPGLITLARLAIKRHFDFVEEDCRKYLEKMGVPKSIFEYVLKGKVA